ncbi:DUF308 domain-containing protein [Eubacteriales bacterium OttesenSCG-928-N13]|nr:DUF308 domain-containing protein [Eubacteriales bacterium OttesenSCG-928-N13]
MLNTPRWLLLISGVLLIVLSIFMFTTPAENVMSLAIFIGISMLVSGVSTVFHWFRSGMYRTGWELASGILSALFGIWILFGRTMLSGLTMAIPFVFSCWVMMSGVMRTVGAFDLKKLNMPRWGWVLAVGIVGIMLGFVLMFHPMIAAITLGIAIAILFLFEGIVSVAMALALK